MNKPIDFLKNCIDKAVQKQGKQFAEEYGKYGLWANPFNGFDYPLTSNFDSLFIGRQNIIEELSPHFVGSFLGYGKDVAIIGSEGVGSRTLVNLFREYIYNLNSEEETHTTKKIKEKLYDIFEMKAHSINEDIINHLKKQIEIAVKQKKTILISSPFDEKEPLIISNSFSRERFRKLLELDRTSHDKTIFLSPWTPSAFNFMFENEYGALSIYEEFIFIPPFSISETEHLLKTRLKLYTHKTSNEINLFTENSLKHIAAYSGGISKFALKFASIILEEAIKSKRNQELTENYINSVLINNGYKSYEQIKLDLKELLPQHWWEHNKHKKTEFKILINTILLVKPTTSTEIGKLIGKSRVAIIENLKKLDAKKIIKYVEDNIDSRRRPFIINDFVKSVFEEEFIIPEIKEKLKENDK